MTTTNETLQNAIILFIASCITIVVDIMCKGNLDFALGMFWSGCILTACYFIFYGFRNPAGASP